MICAECRDRPAPPFSIDHHCAPEFVCCERCGRVLTVMMLPTRYFLGLVNIGVGLPLECDECCEPITEAPYVVRFSSWQSDSTRALHVACGQEFLTWIREADGVETWASWETNTPPPLHFRERYPLQTKLAR